MKNTETLFKVHVVFGDIKVTAASSDRQSAVFTAVGQAWSQHTLSELENGYLTSMPMICSFNCEEHLYKFLNEMNEGCDDGDTWLTFTIEELEF